MINWKTIQSTKQLTQILNLSYGKYPLIFKHSNRCPISVSMKNRFDRSWNAKNDLLFEPFLVDVISQKVISNQIAEILDLVHESPQLIILNEGKILYQAAHLDIEYEEIKKIHRLQEK